MLFPSTWSIVFIESMSYWTAHKTLKLIILYFFFIILRIVSPPTIWSMKTSRFLIDFIKTDLFSSRVWLIYRPSGEKGTYNGWLWLLSPPPIWADHVLEPLAEDVDGLGTRNNIERYRKRRTTLKVCHQEFRASKLPLNIFIILQRKYTVHA